MRRTRWLVGIGLLVAMLLTACTPDGETPPTARTSATAGPVLLELAVYGPPQVIAAYTKIAADFTAANPQIVVNVRPFDTHRQAMRALRESVAGNDPPNLFLADVRDLARLEKRKVVRRVDDVLGDRQVDFGDGFVRVALEDFSADAALKCMPVGFSPMVVYYNTDLVHLGRLDGPGAQPVNADNGWSMEEFAKAARRASRHGRKGLYVEPSLRQIAPFVWSGGGELVDDPTAPTTLTLASGASQQAIERLLELVRNPRITYDAGQLRKRTALKRFEAGRLGMILGDRSLTPVLRRQSGLHFDVMPMPRLSHRATVGTGQGLCIARRSPNLPATADFLAYLTSPEPMSLLAQTGFVVPTNLDVASSEAFTQPGQMPAHAQVFTTWLRYARQLPRGPRWDRAADAAEADLRQLFYQPVIDPLEQKLVALDEESASILSPPSAPSSPTDSPSS